MKQLLWIALSWLAVSCFGSGAFSQPIHIVTENFPPFNYEEGGEIKGKNTEVVRMVLKELNIQPEIEVLPWARAFQMAKDLPNVMIYSITRHAKRENLFKWVGQIAPSYIYLFSLKTNPPFRIHTLEDARPYRIGTVREDYQEHFLLSHGFAKGVNIMPGNRYELGLKKLLNNRIDLWAVPESTAFYLARREGYDPLKILRKEFAFDQISHEGNYIAFGVNTSDQIVEKFRKALAKVKQQGNPQKTLD